MWYSVDIQKLGALLLPPILRQRKTMAFIGALLKPLEATHYEFTQFRNDTIYRLNHNWQICYMRGALNDKFDQIERRIYIGDSSIHDALYIFVEAEAQAPEWLNTEGEEDADTVWLYTEAETADTGVDFIVWVPKNIIEQQIHELTAEIEFYKLGGTKYLIQPINE